MAKGPKKRKQPNEPTKVVAIMNQKGGVGKSTTAVNLSAALGEKKFKVLVIDSDPQGNATSGFGIEKNKIEKSIYDALLSDVDATEVICQTSSDYIDIIPANIQLAGAEVELVSVMAREVRMKEVVDKVKGEYDYVFIDCPPSLGILTVNALTASDFILVPIQCEYYALEGVTKLLESMKMVKARLNPSLEILGIVMTMYDSRTSLSKQVVQEVSNYFGDKMFKTLIPRNVRLSEAPSLGQTIFEYDAGSKGAEAYKKLAKEVVNRG